jgi:hypothetical protein
MPLPFVCRPHSPGQLRGALTGRTLTVAHRRGKAMWCETSGAGRSSVYFWLSPDRRNVRTARIRLLSVSV